MTIRDLQILFQKETGKYPPHLLWQDRTIKYKRTATEECYLKWLHNKLNETNDERFKNHLLPDFWFESSGK